jgi:hypothetical protein
LAAHQWIAYIDTAGVPHQSQPSFSDISGTVAASQLPAPTASMLGGIASIVSAAHQWISYIDTSGLPHQSQPSFADISGTMASSQCPAGTASAIGCVKPDGSTITVSAGVLTAIGSSATAVADLGTTVTGATAGNLQSTTNSGCSGTTPCLADSGIAATAVAKLTASDQTLSGGANVTSLSQSTGSLTVDCGARPLQYITNNGAFTITAPSNDGSCMVLVTNGASAAAITFSGFTVGSNTGDALTTTNASKFIITIVRINAISTYLIKALQ